MSSFKNKYGQVFTPEYLIQIMFNLLPTEITTDFCRRWLDPGAGEGQFTSFVYKELMQNLGASFPSTREREKHIMKNMLTMIEINPYNIQKINDNFSHFSHQPNIISGNYLESTFDISFDIIIGNPPFNVDGERKVPTNKSIAKNKEGTNMWINFVRKSIELLSENGYLCFIIPSIWLKPDKEKIYDLLTQYQIHHMICYNNTETNKIFNGQAQTPTVIFTLQKTPKYKNTLIFDKDTDNFVEFNIQNNIPIPTYGVSIVNKILKITQTFGSLSKYVHKSNPISNKINTFNESKEHLFPNITSCKINLQNNNPFLVINYTDKPCPFYGKPKLVLAHKMYGFPFFDKYGKYGVSSRDNYIILHDDLDILQKFHNLLSTNFAIYLFETTRYRMKYLEKYVFEYIPDITNIHDFPHIINENSILTYFGINDDEKKYINTLHKKTYSFFY
jgi:hypothetical protein